MTPVRRFADAWQALPPNARGALWILVGTVVFALNDGVVKAVGHQFHPAQIALFRYAVGFVALVPICVRVGRASWRTDRLGLHLFRAVVAGIGQAGVYYAVIHLMLADATAVAFTRPLFLTLLAVVVLGETVGWRRWAATAFGFAGVLVMVRPGQAGLDAAWGVALVASALFALGMILIRRLSSTEPPIRILFYYQGFGTVLFVGPAIALWRPPNGEELALLLLIGALTTVAMTCFVRGLSAGEASVVGPLEYTRLIYASLIGYYVFAEVPSVWTLAGAFMIVGSALYIARREAFGGRAGRLSPRPGR